MRYVGWLLVALSLSCSRAPAEPVGASRPAPAASATASASPSASETTAPKGPPITWDDPSAWTRLAPANPARLANYLVRRAPGDPENAEVGVFYFGPDQGGDPDDNLDRWLGQFTEAKRPHRFTRKVNGMRQTIAEIEGTFASGMPGGPPGPSKPGFRLEGAIVETPVGLYFFKMTGPRATVLAARSAFLTMLDSVRKKEP